MNNDNVSLISTVGFPIVACIYMARTMRAEIQALTTAVGHMIDTLNNLNDRLDRLEVKYDEQRGK